MSAVTISSTEQFDTLCETNEIETCTDYLTPEQRLQAIAEILATGALRVLKERHEQDIQ